MDRLRSGSRPNGLPAPRAWEMIAPKPGPKQVPLPLGLPSEPAFANFIVGQNQEARTALGAMASGAGERVICLWGENGTGKTHLLKAVCGEAARLGRRAVYRSCRTGLEPLHRLIKEPRRVDLLCIDDIHALAGDENKETTLFHLYNLLETEGIGLLAAGEQNPAGGVFSLPDLGSRLAAALVLRLHPLDDGGRRMALQYRARERGFTLTDEVTAFLLRRCHRDMHSLLALLDEIDKATLVEKRLATIPFVRRLLDTKG